jgi:hypothetical protein
MSTITRQILEKALVLPAAERADLVESLLASLGFVRRVFGFRGGRDRPRHRTAPTT